MCWWIFGHCWHTIQEDLTVDRGIHGKFGRIKEKSNNKIMECCKCGKTGLFVK